MKVKVKVAGGVVKFMPGGLSEKDADIAEKGTISDLLGSLGIPEDVPKVILLNRTTAKLDTKLSEGDIIHLLPMVVGG